MFRSHDHKTDGYSYEKFEESKKDLLRMPNAIQQLKVLTEPLETDRLKKAIYLQLNTRRENNVPYYDQYQLIEYENGNMIFRHVWFKGYGEDQVILKSETLDPSLASTIDWAYGYTYSYDSEGVVGGRWHDFRKQ